MMMQQEPKAISNHQFMSKKFDEDFKKLQRQGSSVLEKLQPHYIPNIKYQDLHTGVFIEPNKSQAVNNTLQLSD